MMSLCKDYLKDCSTGRAGLNGYSAVMYAHDFMNQGQPKAYSAKLAASGFIYAEEWFKYRSPGWLVLFHLHIVVNIADHAEHQGEQEHGKKPKERKQNP